MHKIMTLFILSLILASCDDNKVNPKRGSDITLDGMICKTYGDIILCPGYATTANTNISCGKSCTKTVNTLVADSSPVAATSPAGSDPLVEKLGRECLEDKLRSQK